jgi:predicted RNase H-like HicB family nuclease
MQFTLECELEEDGRWCAGLSDLPGALAYGNTAAEAAARTQALALRVLAERLEHGEVRPLDISFSVPAGV